MSTANPFPLRPGQAPFAPVFGGLFSSFVVLLALTAHPVQAADGFKKGDEVQVFFLNQWWDGTVVQTNPRGDVMADFAFGGIPKRDVFKAALVRYAYEADALARARTWSDPSGTFKVKAAPVAFVEDAILLRKEDKSELKVPIAKLSPADQEFLKRLKKDLGPSASRPPKPGVPETFDSGKGQSSWASWGGAGATLRSVVEPDPLPAFVKLKQGGVAFPNIDFFDRLGAVLPLGGPKGWILASVENTKPTFENPQRLLWVSLVNQKVENQQLLPPGEVLLDYHPPTRQLLTYTTVNESGEFEYVNGVRTLTLWKAAPTDASVTLVSRWFADPKEVNLVEPWGRILDATTVLHRWKKNEYIAWDVANKQAKYRLSQESFFAPEAQLSGGRRYLVLPEDKQVQIIEALTGQLVSSYPAPNGSSAAGISEDGTRLAVLDRNSLAVWDLASRDSEPQHYQAEAIGTPFTATLEWLTNDRIMVSSGWSDLVMFSLPHKISLWNYKFDSKAIPEKGDRRVRAILDGHLVYAATVDAGQYGGLAVGAVQLPGPKVEEEAARFDPESILLIKPGVELAVNIQCGENNQRVYEAVQKIATANGWVLNQNAPLTIYCEMKHGEQQTVTYQSFRTGASQSVTFAPFISNFRILRGEEVAWEQGTSTGAPPVMRLDQNQSAQTEVDRWQRPNVEFFEQLEVPGKILDPKRRNGLGSTRVTNRGLVSK